MEISQNTILTLEQKQFLFDLWNSEYPERICYSEISEFENYLQGLSNQEHYLLIDEANRIVGWSFSFVRENDKWFAIILNSKVHRKGYGTFLLQELKKNNLVLNGWVVDHQNEIKRNGELYISPMEFYTKNGFLVNHDLRIENDKISGVKIRWERE
jgi:hypothetical protein